MNSGSGQLEEHLHRTAPLPSLHNTFQTFTDIVSALSVFCVFSLALMWVSAQ